MKTESSPRGFVQSLLDHADTSFHRNEIAGLNARLGDWFATADFLARVVRELGQASQEQEWPMLDKSVACSRLSLALDSVSAALPVPSAAPLALLANLSDERHVLGSSIMQVCLRSAGYDTLRLRENASDMNLVSYIRDSRVALVALSASAGSTDAATLGAAYRDIALACKKRGAILVLGGSGQWPEPIDYGSRCHSFEDLRAVLW